MWPPPAGHASCGGPGPGAVRRGPGPHPDEIADQLADALRTAGAMGLGSLVALASGRAGAGPSSCSSSRPSRRGRSRPTLLWLRWSRPSPSLPPWPLRSGRCAHPWGGPRRRWRGFPQRFSRPQPKDSRPCREPGSHGRRDPPASSRWHSSPSPRRPSCGASVIGTEQRESGRSVGESRCHRVAQAGDPRAPSCHRGKPKHSERRTSPLHAESISLRRRAKPRASGARTFQRRDVTQATLGGWDARAGGRSPAGQWHDRHA